MWNEYDMMKILSASWSWQEFKIQSLIMKLTRSQDSRTRGIYVSVFRQSTYYDKHQMITSWADERVEDDGYEMNNEWFTKQAESKFQRISPSREFVSKHIKFFRITYNLKVTRCSPEWVSWHLCAQCLTPSPRLLASWLYQFTLLGEQLRRSVSSLSTDIRQKVGSLCTWTGVPGSEV